MAAEANHANHANLANHATGSHTTAEAATDVGGEEADEDGWNLVKNRRRKQSFSQESSRQIIPRNMGKQGHKSVYNTDLDRRKQKSTTLIPDRAKASIRGHGFAVNPKASPISWCDLVKGKKQDETIQYFNPIIVNDRKTAVIEEEELRSAEKMWSNSILIYLVGKRPYYMFFKAYIKRVWLPKGKFEVYARDNGFYLVQFELAEDCNKILEGGPWMMDGKFIIMKKWNSSIKYEKDLLLSIPIWVKFPNLNFAYWNHITLCKIASTIGKPLAMDEHTKNKSRIAFARMLIEVDASSKFENEVQIKLPNGDCVMQQVEYEFIPPVCHNCICFGHMDNECPISFKQKWIPKQACSNQENKSKDTNTADVTVQQILYVNSQGVVYQNAETITTEESNVQNLTAQNKENNSNIENVISPSDSNARNVKAAQTLSEDPAVAIVASPAINAVSVSLSTSSMAATIAKGHNDHVSETLHTHNIEQGPLSTNTLDINAVISSAKASISSSSLEIIRHRELSNHNNEIALNNSNPQISDLTTVVSDTLQVQKDKVDSKVEESSLSQSCINPTYPSNDKPPNIMSKNLTSINPEFEKEIADMRIKNSHDRRKNKGILESVTPTIRTRSQAHSTK
jgi:hypothetical protein